MVKKKSKDLWKAEGPAPSRAAVKDAPRRPKRMAPHRPNCRSAVAVPLPGQSYNPTDSDHQAALAKAVRKLQKKKSEDAKFVQTMTMGRNLKIRGNFSADKTWEEEVVETPAPLSRTPKTREVLQKEATQKKKKEKRKKKLGKKGSAREARSAMRHRRHPNREVVEREAAGLDALLKKHSIRQEKLASASAKRREIKKENLQIKHFGRHYHTPLVVDVLPSENLVGSLRHMSGGIVHPVLERMKSLEERNLIPARMRHSYNKRTILKPKGELRLKKETFGVLPETSF
ncbi:unnamed protein product [Phytomonas sp. Hart1]|nr:unnamed protein product [Phytomonas sp. Hart1]|eukprot:CCW69449.1 unnamed protein product [Phytomonas sp. isolate Hart1]